MDLTTVMDYAIFNLVIIEIEIERTKKMKKIKTHYINTLNSWIDESEQNAKRYMNDFRQDEAEMEKIKTNIYSIFLKMFHLSLNKTNDQEKFRTMYLNFHKTIPKNWHNAKEKAKENESIDYYIEDLKITTATRVEKLFNNLWDNHE